ncbi:MAG: hypothetical protein M3R13_01255 [Armatimonadota bacterium]|nr:hypothetical protein [Armatimonadota bacterium]
MRFICLLPVLLLLACAKDDTYIPPPPTYFLVIPDSKTIWAEHIEKGFTAGCKQMDMAFEVVKYTDADPQKLTKLITEMGDSKGAPACIVFNQTDGISKTLDALSLKEIKAITIGRDDSNAFRLGHVGANVKKLASLVATRSKQITPPARKLLYLFGGAPVDRQALEAAAFRESDNWNHYRLRTKSLSEITPQDFEWCDVVIPVGEDALAKAIQSPARHIIPTDPTDEAFALLKDGRAPIVIGSNYFDIGFRASRIAREQFVYKAIASPILPITPKEVDKESLAGYMKSRFNIPPIQRSKPAKKSKP